MKYSTKSFMHIFWFYMCIAVLLFLSYADSYAYKGDEFVTPDSWNRHITSNGVRSSINGISFGDTGLLKMGYTTPAADTRAKADVQYYGRPDIRENNFDTKLPLDNTAAFNPEFAHTYADDNTTGKFNYTEAEQAGTIPAPTH